MIKAVLFDLDDTLYGEYDYVDQAFLSVAKVIAQSTLQDVTAGQIHRRMWAILEQEGRGKIFDRICREYRVDIPIQELVKVYRSTKPVLHLYPDAEQMLGYLRNKKIKTGLITDGCSMVQHAKIDALKLHGKMDVLLATDDLGVSKPNQEVYLHCLRELGCQPNQAMYVGDNPNKDFCGAKAIGMKTLRIRRMQGDHMQDEVSPEMDAHAVIHTLSEIEMFLEEVL